MSFAAKIAIALCVSACIALSNVPMSNAQTILDISAIYTLPRGFFVYNVQDNAVLGANSTWSLTDEVTYAKAFANSQYFLFNLTYNRNIGGVPPNFNSSQFFEINMISAQSGRYLEWNVYGYRDQVDLWPVEPTAQTNVLFSFQIVDPVYKVYIIQSRLNGMCVGSIGGGVDFVLTTCQSTNSSQQFQFIDPFTPTPAPPTSSPATPPPPPKPGKMEILDISAIYSLPYGFFVSNVNDNAVLGAFNRSWSLAGGVPYNSALSSNIETHLFNLTYNRILGGTPPNFNSTQYFEINLPSTLSATYLQWNVWSWRDQVDLYAVGNTAASNTLFSFEEVDSVNKIYTIKSKLNNYCVATIGGGKDFVLTQCIAGNTTQQFQFINPFGAATSSDSDNFFSTAGGVVVILLIIGLGIGLAYGGWRFYQKRNQSHQKLGSSVPALLKALNGNGADQDSEQDDNQASYGKINDNMELGKV